MIGLFLGWGFTSRVVVVVIISLFPIITNTLFGLKSVDRGLDDLFALHTSSRWVRLWKLQLPGSLPAMFVGFQIAAGLSVIGAIVGDFFFARGARGSGTSSVSMPTASNPSGSGELCSSPPCSASSSSQYLEPSGPASSATGTNRRDRRSKREQANGATEPVEKGNKPYGYPA